MEPVLEKPKRKSPTPKKKDGEDREVIIYKIEIAGTNFLYVGHTEDFNQRENNHKTASKANLTVKSKNSAAYHELYNVINQNGGWEKVSMTPMEKFVSKGKIESRIREQYWIDKIQVARRDAVMMNACRAYVSPEQHRAEINATCLKNNLKRITCACGIEHPKGNKSAHIKTKKHINWVKANETKSVEIVLDVIEV